MSGVMSINMPAFLRGVNYLSPLRYAIRNLGPYSLRDIVFTCSDSQRLPDGQCPITTGLQVLDLYGLNANPTINIVAIGVTAVVYRLLAYIMLKIARTHWGDGRRKTRHYKEVSTEYSNGTLDATGTGSASA
jgi:hypothetical protein